MSTGTAAQANVASFLQMLFFNYLVAATDAHAKNYSLMLSADGIHRLAPMYDVASIAPYVEPGKWQKKPPKLAMSIGGENRIGRLSLGNVSKLHDQCNLEKVGIDAEGCTKLLTAYADIIPGKIADVFDSLEGTSAEAAAKELRIHMEEPIARLCSRTKEQLSG